MLPQKRPFKKGMVSLAVVASIVTMTAVISDFKGLLQIKLGIFDGIEITVDGRP